MTRHEPADTQQLELFADLAEQRLRDWLALFARADWVAPHDCEAGPAGTVVLGWRCPDPACGQVEINDYLLDVNHGLDPHRPDPFFDEPWCRRLALLANQRHYGEQHAELEATA